MSRKKRLDIFSWTKNKNSLRDAKRGDDNRSISIKVWGDISISLGKWKQTIWNVILNEISLLVACFTITNK